MAIRWISAAWKTHLQTICPPTDRFYIDFRQKEYPAVVETDVTYNTIGSADNQPGYKNLIVDDNSTVLKYLYTMPSKFTLRLYLHPQFAYDTADIHYLFSWYVSATQFFSVYYAASTDTINMGWYDGGTARFLTSRQFDDGSSYEDIDAWLTIDAVMDTTTGDTTGSALYINRTADDTAWAGNIDAMSTSFPLAEVGTRNSVTFGDSYYNHIRLFPNYTASATDVGNDYADVLDEEIHWSFDGHTLGKTRCNVTSSVLRSGCGRATEDLQTGTLTANRLNVTLNSDSGEYADEQYAAFDPANQVYNGLTGQRYMTKRCGVSAETWYSTLFEPYFIGRVEGGFRRSTPIGGISTVGVGAVDQTAEVANSYVRKGQYWEDKKISDATEADSLVHLITRLGTQRTVYNYLANSSFENATIGNSWLASAGTLTRGTDELLGDYCGSMANGTGAEVTVSQTVTMTGTKKLNKGETWTFSVYLKSAAAATAEIRIEEHDAGGINGAAVTTTYSLAGGEGWVPYEVSRDIGDTTSDRVVVYIEVAAGKTVLFDCASMDQNDRAREWFVLNNNDGAAGVESADDADSDTYDSCGFDVDAVAYVHGWARVDKGESVWGYVMQLADASAAYQCGFSEAGTFTFKAVLATGYADPTAVETVDKATNVSAVLEPLQANKIVVYGVKILKDDNPRVVWNAPATGVFTQGKGYPMYETVANGNDFPDSTTYPEFVAAYDEEGDATAGTWAGRG